MTQSDETPNNRDRDVEKGITMSARAARRWLALVLAMLLGALGVIAYITAYFKFPRYTAEAYFECVSPMPKRGLQLDEMSLPDEPFLRFVKSQALYIKSAPVLSVVLQDPTVRETAWYHDTDPDKRLDALTKLLDVQPVKDTHYIRVAASTRSPDDPHKIVNTVVSKYLQQVRDMYAGPYRDELNEYRRELDQVQKQIMAKNEQIRTFRATLEPGNIPEDRTRLGGGVLRDTLFDNQKTVTDLEQQTLQLENMKMLYADPAGPAVAPEDRAAVEQDPRVDELDRLVFTLERERSVAEKKNGSNSPEFADLSIRKDEAEKQLATLRATRLHELLEVKKEQIELAWYNAQDALASAQARLMETRAKQAELERKQSDYVMLLDDRDVLVQIQNRIDEYVREVDRVVRAESSAVRVVSAVSAQPPEVRSFPRPYMLPLAAILPIVLLPVLRLVWIGCCRIWLWTLRPAAARP